ncbi:MAG: LPS export ABC transporter periplasmic protein LptC [Ottowia sp.]|nr:LPS export ABC transporter periplasmic protein LptC [Ottowia sp.]
MSRVDVASQHKALDLARLRRYARDHLAAWLPVLVMAGFALGTFWLVRSAPRLNLGAAAAPPSHDPDYRMQHFSVRNFDADGQLSSELTGDSGTHYPDTDTLEVAEPRMRSYGENGEVTDGEARRGVANHDGSHIQLYDDARIWRDAWQDAEGNVMPPMEFQGEYLNALTRREQVDSDQPVKLIRGADWFVGDTFDYDNHSGVANLRGNVRGVIQPAAGD